MTNATDPCLHAGNEAATVAERFRDTSIPDYVAMLRAQPQRPSIADTARLNAKQAQELEGKGFERGYAEGLRAAASMLRTFHPDLTRTKRPSWQLKSTQDFVDIFERWATINGGAA